MLPFQREPDFAAVSVNYRMDHLADRELSGGGLGVERIPL
jgi:hypothetical protein